MKPLICLNRTFAVVSALILLPSIYAMAADTPAAEDTATKSVSGTGVTSSVTTTVTAPAPATDSREKLPYGADEVVKLSRGQVSDDVILTYVQNSGIAYSLGPDDIVRLRKEGVSDRVINSMLEQHKRAVQVAQASTASAPVNTDSAPPAGAAETAPAPTQPPVVEAPLTPTGSSSAYVIPYQPTTYGVYGYYPYPYYGPYYGGPIVSFRFGFGGRGHFHRWR